jgi:hypothetical protein
VILQVLTLPTRADMPHQASYAAAGELVKAGVKIAFAVPSETKARQLPLSRRQEAVGWGLARVEALKALDHQRRRDPGCRRSHRQPRAGKIANLFIAKGDPLEVRTAITHVVIAGRDVPLDNKQLALYERYAKRP